MNKNNKKQIKVGDKVTYFSPKNKEYAHTGEITHLYNNDAGELATCKLKGKHGTFLIENLKILW